MTGNLKRNLSIRDYNNQVAAFNKSEQVFGQTNSNIIMLAADQAFADNELQFI